MATPNERTAIVEERLKSYLTGDHQGVRRAIIKILLTKRDLSIQEIYEQVGDSFSISFHSVAGMMGILSSRIGILQALHDHQQKCRVYRIREKDIPTVTKVMLA